MAAKVWSRMSRAIDLISGEPSAVEALWIRQNLDLALQRANTRAILCRFPSHNETHFSVTASSLLCAENTHYEEVDGDLMEQ